MAPDWDGTAGGALQRRVVEIGAPGPGEALVEPLLGAWEANIDHALTRTPIDVCSARGEESVILGNLGVVRVLTSNPVPGGPSVEPGTVCLLMPFGRLDRHGYVELVHAYDCPGTMGLLAKRSVLPLANLLPIPESTPYSIEQWATYGRYFTAWDNWRAALGCWRTQLPDADPAEHLVLGWGGGVALAELTLAARAGFRTAMTVGSDERRELVEKSGITALDRRNWPGLQVPARGATPDEVARHEESVAAFVATVRELSDGAGASILIDNIGTPLWKLSSAVLARQGVISTCGWKAGMRIPVLRGAECMARHLHVNTHVWRSHDVSTIRDVMETTEFLPPQQAIEVWDFDDVPSLAQAYNQDRVASYFALYRVND
ncbi:zinc-binding dehydrogenase [Micromonospora sp. CP22]|nr:zinc-binding dehydrogenase [Micromonospora sp. CP22]